MKFCDYYFDGILIPNIYGKNLALIYAINRRQKELLCHLLVEKNNQKDMTDGRSQK